MDRRAFISFASLSLLVTPLAARAQPADKNYRIGYLVTSFVSPTGPFPAAFVPALRDLGYVQGHNLVIEVRSAHERPERLPALASEIVGLNVDVIVTAGDGEVRAAKQQAA